MGRPARVLTLAVLALLAPGTAALPPAGVDVVATGVPRPLQLAFDLQGFLLALSPGAQGDSAGEIFRVPLDARFPLDLSTAPRLRIPFAPGSERTALGSLAVEPASGDLFLGEENGRHVYRLAADTTLTLYARGLHRLLGGTSLAFDSRGRLLVVDYADSVPASIEEEASPPDFEWLRGEDYKGPLLFRLDLDPDARLPRDLGRAAPLFPRGWGGRTGGGLLPRLISVAASAAGEVFVLSSSGDLYRVTADRTLEMMARLPLGQYQRISMVAGPAGEVLVSGGFHVGSVFRVSGDGVVTTLVAGLADPEGIARDAAGRVYVAESSLHRIIRLITP